MTVVLSRVRLRRPLLVGMLGTAALRAAAARARCWSPRSRWWWPPPSPPASALEVFGLGWNLAMQENIDGAELSRAYSYDALGSFVAIPLGQLVSARSATASVRPGHHDRGVAYVAVALAVLLSRSVRTLPRAPRSAAGRLARPQERALTLPPGWSALHAAQHGRPVDLELAVLAHQPVGGALQNRLPSSKSYVSVAVTETGGEAETSETATSSTDPQKDP